VAGVPASRALELNTVAMGLLLVVTPLAGSLSDRVGQRTLLAWAQVC